MTYKKLSILHLLYLHSMKRLIFCFFAYLLLCAGLLICDFLAPGNEALLFRIVSALFVVSVSFINLEAASKSLGENSNFVGRLDLSASFLKRSIFFYQTAMFFLMHGWIVLTNLILLKLHVFRFSLSFNRRAELSAKMMSDPFLAKIFVFFDFANYLLLLTGVLFIFLFSVLFEAERGPGRLVNFFLALLIAYLTVFMHG